MKASELTKGCLTYDDHDYNFWVNLDFERDEFGHNWVYARGTKLESYERDCWPKRDLFTFSPRFYLTDIFCD